jgi:hypothetical protein
MILSDPFEEAYFSMTRFTIAALLILFDNQKKSGSLVH